MISRASIAMVCLCALLALASSASAAGIPVVVTATAYEAGGIQPDVFSLTFTCDCDIRILQAIWDMTSSAGHLYFDTFPSGSEGYDFHTLPDTYFPGLVSTASVFQYFSADNSPQLVVQFTEFKPGQVLYFDIDVDGLLSTTFTGADFAGTWLGIIFDPSPAFPGAQPVGVVFRFTEFDGQGVVHAGGDVLVPEPATLTLLGVGAVGVLALRRRRRGVRLARGNGSGVLGHWGYDTKGETSLQPFTAPKNADCGSETRIRRARIDELAPLRRWNLCYWLKNNGLSVNGQVGAVRNAEWSITLERRLKMNCKRLNLAGIAAIVLLVAGQSYAPPIYPNPAPVDLGTAGNFTILAKTGISTVPTSSIVGDIGVSPIDSTAITGFSLILDGSGTFSTSTQVTGKVYAADYTFPTPTYVGTAVGDMQTAYTDAAGRAADATGLGAGNIGGLTLTRGVYAWGTGVTIPTDVTLSGSASDVWIFQIAGTLNISSGKKVILDGAQASNIFWQVADTTTLETTSEFKGTILDQTLIEMKDGAMLDGRALAQSAVTLIQNTVTAPVPVPEPCALLLLGSGLAGLVAWRKRSRSAA